MKKLKLEEAIGKPLANDMTRIIPGKVKGAAFKRGHILRAEDIPMLKDMGKAHVYVLDPEKGYIHEDDAAVALSQAYGGEAFERQGPGEGRINLKARFQGLLKINLPLLNTINETGDIICSTLHQHTVCAVGMTVAATRIIPVAMDEVRFNRTLEVVRRDGPLLRLLPFVRKKVGVIVTGEEVFSGRIPDSSRDILSPKIACVKLISISKFMLWGIKYTGQHFASVKNTNTSIMFTIGPASDIIPYSLRVIFFE